MPGKRSLAFVFVAALVSGWIVPGSAPAQPVDADSVVYMLTRSNPKAGPLDASTSLEWEGDGQHMMVVTLEKKAKRYKLLTAMYSEAGVDLWPRIHHGGSGGPDCVPSPLCSFPLNDALVHPVPAEDTDVAFVAAVGGELKIEVRSAGWKLQEIDPALFQVVNERTSGSTGVRFTGNYSFSRFTHASLEGGPGGSVAFASLPCDPNEGVGEAVLAGGQPWPPGHSSEEFYCTRPDGTYWLWGLAVSPGATKWDFEGDVIGAGAFYDARLAVLSLPDVGLPLSQK